MHFTIVLPYLYAVKVPSRRRLTTDSSEEPTTRTSVSGEQQCTPESSSSKAAGSSKSELGSLEKGSGLSWELRFRASLAGACLILFAIFMISEYYALTGTDDIVDAEGAAPWNTTPRAALTAETEEYTTDFAWSEPKKDKGGQPIDATEPALYRWVVTCQTPECMMQERWVTYLVQKQVNPCWETNAFVCDGTPLPTMEHPIPMASYHLALSPCSQV
ncbi:hypothetical protein MRX96_011048 [Rhipicephalus microplus]